MVSTLRLQSPIKQKAQKVRQIAIVSEEKRLASVFEMSGQETDAKTEKNLM